MNLPNFEIKHGSFGYYIFQACCRAMSLVKEEPGEEHDVESPRFRDNKLGTG